MEQARRGLAHKTPIPTTQKDKEEEERREGRGPARCDRHSFSPSPAVPPLRSAWDVCSGCPLLEAHNSFTRA